jgi:hypothetical protein
VAASAKGSSQEFSYTPASAAIDNNYSTRWSSLHTDNQWLAVDLGSVARVDSVRITWQSAFASSYAIQTATSMNGPWTTVASQPSGKGGIESVTIGANTEFLRLQGIKRATAYGYSVYELTVYGSRDLACGNLLKGWNTASVQTDVPGAGNYAFVSAQPNEILFPLGAGSACPGGPAYFTFTQNVTVPAGHTFHLALDITNLSGQANQVAFAASLGSVGGTNFTPASDVRVVPGGGAVPVGVVTGDGTIGADFVVDSTSTQTLPLSITTFPPAIGAGTCISGFLESFTLADATLAKVN